MDAPEWTDADYEVIADPRPRPSVAWSFWADDFPNLAGIVAAVLTAGVVLSLFR